MKPLSETLLCRYKKTDVNKKLNIIGILKSTNNSSLFVFVCIDNEKNFRKTLILDNLNSDILEIVIATGVVSTRYIFLKKTPVYSRSPGFLI